MRELTPRIEIIDSVAEATTGVDFDETDSDLRVIFHCVSIMSNVVSFLSLSGAFRISLIASIFSSDLLIRDK